MGSNQDFVFRFAVGDETLGISSEWRLWFDSAERDCAQSDVYFSGRYLGGKLKLSIHESGEINFSFDGNFAKKLDMRNQQRHIYQWRIDYAKPVFKVIVPYTELKTAPFSKGKVHYLPPPIDNFAIEVYLYIVRQSIKNVLPEEFSLFLEEDLANSNVVTLVWRNNAITKDNALLYLTYKEKLQQILSQKKIIGKNLRGYLLVDSEVNGRGIIDLAL